MGLLAVRRLAEALEMAQLPPVVTITYGPWTWLTSS